LASKTAIPSAAPAPSVCGRRFFISGVELRLETDSDEALTAGTTLLEHFGLERGPVSTVEGPPVQLRVTRRPPSPPSPEAEVVARHFNLVVRSAGDVLFIDDGRAAVRIDLAAGDAVLHTAAWPTGPAAGRPYLIVVYTLLTLLRRRGLVPLHAAAVERAGEGVLMVAPSGSGKSTLSLVLLQDGWNVVSDDSVLLHLDAFGHVSARGLRRDLFLRTPEDDFPELVDLWTSSPELDRGKRRLVIERRFPDRVTRTCDPSCILFPEIKDAATSRLVPCPTDEVLFRLLDHSTIADLEPGAARSHIGVLGALTRQTRAFVLEAARDLLDDPGSLDRLLAPAMARRTTAGGAT